MILLGAAALGSGCATSSRSCCGTATGTRANLVFGPSVFAMAPTDTPRDPWPIAEGKPNRPLSTHFRTEVRDIQYGHRRPVDSYYRRFDSVRSSERNPY